MKRFRRILAAAVATASFLFGGVALGANLTEKVGDLVWEYSIENDCAVVRGVASTVSGNRVEGEVSVPAKLGERKVTIIGFSAFRGQEFITKVNLPDGVVTVGEVAFDGCKRLKEIALPPTVTKVYNYAFRGCASLSDLKLNEGLKEIGYDALANCSSLVSLKLPSTVEKLGNNLFAGLPLVEMEIPDSVIEIGSSLFQGCTKLEKVVVGKRVPGLSFAMFRYCEMLADVTLKEGYLDYVGECAFDGCKRLKEIALPPTVTKVYNYAFRGCSELTAAVFSGKAPKLDGNSVFSGVNSAFTVYVTDAATDFGSTFAGFPVKNISEKPQGGDEPQPPATYAIAYDLDGGVNAAANPTSYTEENLPITLAAPTKEGYEFLGWTPDNGVIAAGTAKDVAFTATWKKTCDEPEPPQEIDPIDVTKANYWSAAYGEDGSLTVSAAKGKTKKGVTTSAVTVKLTLGKKVYTYKNGVLGADGEFVKLPDTPKGAPVLADLTLDGEGVEGLIDGVAFAGCKVVKPAVEELEVPAATVGVAYYGGVLLSEASYPVKFSAKKLPSGLKINAVTGEIAGVPTKAGVFKATVLATSTLDKTLKTEIPVEIEVSALSPWVVGTYNGGGAYGQVSLTVGKNGKISGKYLENGSAYSFSTVAFAYHDAERDGYLAAVQIKVGQETETLTMAFVPDEGFGGVVFCDDSQGELFTACLNRWKDAAWKAVGKKIANRALTLASGVELKFAANGTVKAAYRDGKKTYSGSAMLVTVGEPSAAGFDGEVWVYIPPKKGAFDGWCEQATVRWDGTAFAEAE